MVTVKAKTRFRRALPAANAVPRIPEGREFNLAGATLIDIDLLPIRQQAMGRGPNPSNGLHLHGVI